MTKAVTFNGTANPDVFNGDSSGETIFGLAKSDVLSGGGGNDDIFGGTGSDILSGDDGNDLLVGGGGNDLISGGIGNDILRGGRGDDALVGGLGNDKLKGGLGADKIDGGEGNDTLFLAFNDTVTVGTGGHDLIKIQGDTDLFPFPQVATVLGFSNAVASFVFEGKAAVYDGGTNSWTVNNLTIVSGDGNSLAPPPA
jgi:Ca2+-binding RTX toxin-like protein